MKEVYFQEEAVDYSVLLPHFGQGRVELIPGAKYATSHQTKYPNTHW